MKRLLRSTMLAATLSALGMGASAADEVEQNHPIQSAQRLIIPPSGAITVNGVIGTVSGAPALDVDFYSFWGKAGDTIAVDIDGGMNAGARNVDTWVGIFGPGSTFPLRAFNDDGPLPLDSGSFHRFDSRIDSFTLDADGIWTIGVSSFPRRLSSGGTYSSTSLGTNSNGDYSLTISGVTPLMLQVNIEVKPGSGELAPVNPKARGTIPVALLSSPDFNALDVKVDAKTLTFGRTGAEQSLRRCGKQGEDVNGDGLPDLVCHFENQDAGFTEDDDRGTVRGMTKTDMPFEGHGMLKVIPVKRPE